MWHISWLWPLRSTGKLGTVATTVDRQTRDCGHCDQQANWDCGHCDQQANWDCVHCDQQANLRPWPLRSTGKLETVATTIDRQTQDCGHYDQQANSRPWPLRSTGKLKTVATTIDRQTRDRGHYDRQANSRLWPLRSTGKLETVATTIDRQTWDCGHYDWQANLRLWPLWSTGKLETVVATIDRQSWDCVHYNWQANSRLWLLQSTGKVWMWPAPLPLLINTQHYSLFQMEADVAYQGCLSSCELHSRSLYHCQAYRQGSKFVDCICKSHDLEIVHMLCNLQIAFSISRLECNLEIV